MNLSETIPELFTVKTLLTSFLLIIFPASLGLLLASVVTFFRIRRFPIISELSDIYVSFTRSVPCVLQLFIVFYAIPAILSIIGLNFVDDIEALPASILGLSFYHSGYLSEVIRPAYLSVSEGQHDAADSLGYTSRQKFFKIIFPQLVPVALPGWGNALIYLVHNSALVMYIGVTDVMSEAHIIMEQQYNQYQLEMYFVLALFYCLICLLIKFVVIVFEKFTKAYRLDSGIVKERN